MQSKAIEVIRHSLVAASAALSLLETEPVRQETVVEVAAPLHEVEVVEVAVPQAETVVEDEPFCGPDPRFVLLMSELNGKYPLRTTAELEDKLGFSFSTMTELLSNEEINFVTRTRRSDSACLIGLDSRN